ncbi:MAG: PHP domain-containing protein [Lachnospiraceae bacterium]|nr:PHP domain-containing protein [Lachnospiraceae bacterium]
MIYRINVDGKGKYVEAPVREYSREADNLEREKIIKHYLDDEGAGTVTIETAPVSAGGIIELHCHTKMSEGKGLIAPGELVRYACEKGYKAIAITDRGNVQAFPEAYRTWLKLWNEYEDRCRRSGRKADKKDFLKVIYGLEGNLLAEDGNVYPVLIYAKNDAGIRNLYRIVTASNLEYYDGSPLIPRKYLDEHRDGLIVGSACVGGEVFAAVNSYDHVPGVTGDKEYEDLIKKKLSWYDFLEMVPFDRIEPEKEIQLERYMCDETVNTGSVPVVAASDAYYLNEKDRECWEILKGTEKGCPTRSGHLMDYKEDCKKLFGQCSSGDPEILRDLPERLFDNRAFIADQIGYVDPLREGRFIPEYPYAEEKLTNICMEKVKELFGADPDPEVNKRLGKELTAIRENGYSGLYMMWRQLVKRSLEEGYPTGIRGAVGSSFVAYLCGITEINPLSKKNGGYRIPAEVFMGLNLDREPDIDINFASEIRDAIQEYAGELPGVGEICRCGTISTMSAKTAARNTELYFAKNELPMPEGKETDEIIEKLTGVKRRNGAHPGGIIVCPRGEELQSFTPLTHTYHGKSVITEFDYHSIDDNLLKFDILGHIQYDMLHVLQEKTGVRTEDIPLDDEKVLKLLCDTECKEIKDLPEFGSEFIRTALIKTAKPETFDDLVKISALGHGTDVWLGNQEEFVEQGIIRLSDCIASRDDILLYLTDMSLPVDDAFRIMDSVRKGKGLKDEQKERMREAGVPEWYIQVCEKIRYLFPKSHAVSYTMMAVRLAYYMVYFPDDYYESISEVS